MTDKNSSRPVGNVMRSAALYFSFLLMCLCFSETARADASQSDQPKKVSVTVRDASITDVFSILEKQTGYSFLYKSSDLNAKPRVSIDQRNKSIAEVLDALLLPHGLGYAIDDDVIIIRLREKPVPNAAPLQDRIITGVVRDEFGNPLEGATIYVQGNASLMTTTDENGRYSLKVPDGSNPVLIATFVGMKQATIRVGADNTASFRLRIEANVLDEAVVVGAYGTVQKRSDMVGSAFQVDEAKFKNLGAQRVDNLLDGLVPGLKIDPNTDLASSTRPRNNVRIRGQSSLSASNEPLWIIDGVRAYTGDRTNMIPGMSTSVSPLSFISPEDIESITVLKDATMTSIYGADGANGVILITTKKGRDMTPRFTASTRYGVARINPSTLFKTLNAAEYLALAKESYLNAPGNQNLDYFPYQDLPDNPYSMTDTDWSDVYYGTGSYTQNNVSLSGRTDKTDYYLSGNYYANQMTIRGNKQERISLRSNIGIQLKKRLKLSINLSASYNTNHLFNPGDDYYKHIPILSPYNPDGSYRLTYQRVARVQDPVTGQFSPGVETVKFFNSVAEREQNDDIQRTFSSMSTALLQYDINDNFTLTSQFGADFQSGHEEMYRARGNWSGMNIQTGEPIGFSRRGHAQFLLWTWIERLNFKKEIGKHQINGLLGFEANSRINRALAVQGEGFANDHIKEVSYAANIYGGGSSFGTVRMVSFFGQGNYQYDRRYYLTVNARKDGNSDFGEDVRWGNFGSAGVSWNLHNEKFFHSDLFKTVKIKASFGSNGNSRLGTQQAKGVYSYSRNDNYLGQNGATMASVWNRTLSWERTYMTNVGVRVNLGNRVDVEVEAYNNKTVDLLSDLDVSRTTGDNRVVRNMGMIQNHGIELTVESRNIVGRDFSWTTEANLSHNRNKLLKLYNSISKVMGDKIWMEDQDVNAFYLVRWAGVDPRDGSPMWYDANGNITHVYNLGDRVPWKSSSPLFTGGISNTFTYKNWTLQSLAVYVAGGYSFSSFGRRVSSDGLNIVSENQSVNQLDRWMKPGDLALSPKPVWQLANASSTRNSTRYLYQTTHLKLKNISLMYRFNQQLANKMGLSDINAALLVDNLGIFTPYDKPGRNSYKQSMSGYPMETAVSVSLNVTF